MTYIMADAKLTLNAPSRGSAEIKGKGKTLGFHLKGQFNFSQKMFVSAIYTSAKGDLNWDGFEPEKVDYSGYDFSFGYKFK